MNKLNRIYLLFISLTIIYIVINLLIPPAADTLTRFGLTPEKARMLKISVLLPYVVIWFVAFFGYVQLRDYSNLIKESKDGRSLSVIADGLMILAIAMPMTALASTVTNYLGETDPGSLPAGTIINHYFELLLSGLAVSYIYKGSQDLAGTIAAKKNDIFEYIFRIGFIALAVLYSYLTLSNPSRQFPTAEAHRAAYYLPDFLLVTTIILPFLIIWYLGFRSAEYIQLYRSNVKGHLYRNSLGYLATGILFVILSRIALRFFNSLNGVLVSSSLRFVLVVVYILLVLIAIGFVVIAIGARRLKKIEEV